MGMTGGYRSARFVLWLDEWQHRIFGKRWRVDWLCDLLDISCGMDPTSPGFPGYPRPRNPFFLAANWWWNGTDLLRHPLYHRRHRRGQHWIFEVHSRVGPRVSIGQRRVLRGWGVKPWPLYRVRHYCFLCEWSEEIADTIPA